MTLSQIPSPGHVMMHHPKVNRLLTLSWKIAISGQEVHHQLDWKIIRPWYLLLACQAVCGFLYCCPDVPGCPATTIQMCGITWAVWAVNRKCSLSMYVFQFWVLLKAKMKIFPPYLERQAAWIGVYFLYNWLKTYRWYKQIWPSVKVSLKIISPFDK